MLSSGAVNGDGTVNIGTGFTSTKLSTGKYKITFDKPRDSLDYSVTVGSGNTSSKPSTGSANRTPESFEVFTVSTREADTGDLIDGTFSFVVTGTETIAVGGGSGSYTPEPMVWSEDLSASGSNERLPETVYTNTQDVPIYVQISIYSTDPSGNVLCYVDGEFFGRNGVSGSSVNFNTPLFIVPSGATYEFQTENGAAIQRWYEAKMPVAVGTGGSPVKAWVNFDGRTSSTAIINGQSNVESVTRNDIGDYTIVFKTPMADTNYVVAGSVSTLYDLGVQPRSTVIEPIEYTTDAVRIITSYDATTKLDSKMINVAIIGNG